MKSLPKKPKDAYEIKNGAIYLDGRKVGSVSSKGDFQIAAPDGTVHSGNFAKLIQAEVRRQLLTGGKEGPTGRMRVGAEAFDVRGGVAHLTGLPVGHVNGAGDYELELNGQALRGNLNTTPGSVWIFSTKRPGASGPIKVGAHSLTAIDGVVFEGGEAVGWLLPDGRYRAVTLEGDHLEGTLKNVGVPAPKLRPPR